MTKTKEKKTKKSKKRSLKDPPILHPKPAIEKRTNEIFKEHELAHRLVNNEKTIRDRNVKKLKRWLSSTVKPFSFEKMMKIWKGLYYCMWMSDKTEIQQELAVTLAQLLHSIKHLDQQFLWIQAFFATIQREWVHIDKLRLDKFYSLIRRFMEESLKLLGLSGWKTELIENFNTVLMDGPLDSSPPEDYASEGLTSHLLDIFTSVLYVASENETLSNQTVLLLLEPYFQILNRHPDSSILARTAGVVFHSLSSKLFANVKPIKVGDSMNLIDSIIQKLIDLNESGVKGSNRKFVNGVRHKLDVMKKRIQKGNNGQVEVEEN